MTRKWKFGLILALAALFVVAALGIAQPPPADPTAPAATGVASEIIAFASNRANAVMAGIVVGLLFKFLPSFRNFTNEWIPVLTAVTSFIVQAVQPASAQAGFLGDLLRTTGGFLAPVALGLIDSRLAKWTHDGWLKGPTTHHWQAPRPTGA